MDCVTATPTEPKPALSDPPTIVASTFKVTDDRRIRSITIYVMDLATWDIKLEI